VTDNNLSNRFESYKENITLFQLAIRLIKEYGKTDKIPLGEIKQSNTGFSEEDLIACCKLAEEEIIKEKLVH